MKAENLIKKDSTRWSLRWYLLLIACVFLIQVLLLKLLSVDPSLLMSQESKPFAFVFEGGHEQDTEASTPLFQADPGLFAVVHPQGFSSGIWDMRHPVERPGNIWTELSYTLDAPRERFTRDFLSFSATNQWYRRHLYNRPRIHKGDLTVGDRPFDNKSVIWIEGDIAARKLVSQPDLPLIEGQDYIGPVMVEVALQGDGHVSSSRILFSSGSEKADDLALELSREMRFDMKSTEASGFGVEWGQISFSFGLLPLEVDSTGEGATP